MSLRVRMNTTINSDVQPLTSFIYTICLQNTKRQNLIIYIHCLDQSIQHYKKINAKHEANTVRLQLLTP